MAIAISRATIVPSILTTPRRGFLRSQLRIRKDRALKKKYLRRQNLRHCFRTETSELPMLRIVDHIFPLISIRMNIRRSSDAIFLIIRDLVSLDLLFLDGALEEIGKKLL